jgi:hypothetical protein
VQGISGFGEFKVSKVGFSAIQYGPLPIDKVRACLGLELVVGVVRFSEVAQTHAFERHPNDFGICLQHLGRIISDPDFIGRGPNQTDGFELIGDVSEGNAIILVAIKLRPDKNGYYEIASTYRIDKQTIGRRIRKGFLKKA